MRNQTGIECKPYFMQVKSLARDCSNVVPTEFDRDSKEYKQLQSIGFTDKVVLAEMGIDRDTHEPIYNIIENVELLAMCLELGVESICVICVRIIDKVEPKVEPKPEPKGKVEVETINLTKRGYKNMNTARSSACQYIKKHGLKSVRKNYIKRDNKVFVELIVKAEVVEVEKRELPYDLQVEALSDEQVVKPLINFIEMINRAECYLDEDSTAKEKSDTINDVYDDYLDDLYEVAQALRTLLPDWEDKNNLIPVHDSVSTFTESENNFSKEIVISTIEEDEKMKTSIESNCIMPLTACC